MLLHYLPSLWIAPAAVKPELIAEIVVRVDKNVAPGDVRLREF
jgi:hypothetical protein